MAASKKIVEQEPSEIELLLPWHAAGTLNAREARKVDDALARDPELARQYAVIREEHAGSGAKPVVSPLHRHASLRFLREPFTANTGLVRGPRRRRLAGAGRLYRHGADEQSACFVPDGLVEHERAAVDHARSFGHAAGASLGAVRPGCACRRRDGTS